MFTVVLPDLSLGGKNRRMKIEGRTKEQNIKDWMPLICKGRGECRKDKRKIKWKYSACIDRRETEGGKERN